MIAQIDLLTYTLTPEEQAPPLPSLPTPEPAPINPREVEYWENRQLFYLLLMNRFIVSGYPHKVAELVRLDAIREQALQQIDRLKGGL